GALAQFRAERGADNPVLLTQVRSRVALARTRPPRAAGVRERRPGCFEAMADRPPRPHVLRLLLRPDEFPQVRVRRDDGSVLVHGERIELLEPRHPDG